MSEFHFSNLASLCDWLESHRFNAGSPENYDEWLNNFFDEGNLIYVRGVEYDYFHCVNLL